MAIRERWTNERLALLDVQIASILREHHPQSARHIFYRMTDPRLAAHVEKTESGYRRVAERVLQLRRSRTIPYSWVADLSRTYYDYGGGWDSPEDPAFIEEVAQLYRRDVWRSTSLLPEVWCEARSMVGVLAGLCSEYGVNRYPTGGFPSESYLWEAAQAIRRSDARIAVIYYVGDYDPSGLHISESTESRLAAFLDSSGKDMHFDRVAINEWQIKAYDLPTKPRKATDNRKLSMTETVEAEAMPAADMCELVEERLTELMPPDALEALRTAEESERYDLVARLNPLNRQ